MKVDKIINTTQQTEIDINDITLLSIEEYEQTKEIVPLVIQYWWLRSPGTYDNNVAVVLIGGSVNYFGLFVPDSYGVRPALILNMQSSNLQIKDKFIFADYTWTVIGENLALCDSVVGTTYFRKDWEAEDSSEYETSDIKKWLEDWLKERVEE